MRELSIDIDEPELFRITEAYIHDKWEMERFGIKPLYAPARGFLVHQKTNSQYGGLPGPFSLIDNSLMLST